MFSINLLPASEQRAIRMEEMRRGVLSFSVLVILVLGVGFVMLMPSLALTHFAAQEMERSLALEEAAAQHGEVGAAIERMRVANAAVRDIRAYAAEASRASALLERFLKPGPGLTLLSFTLGSEGSMFLSGHAATRGDLLRFEEDLRASQRFYEITFPLANIIRERDIRFSVHGMLKPEYGL